jgi:hypothetical protein
MPVSAVAASHLSGRDVIVTLVGGTLLSIALTRPRLQWVEQLTKDSDKHRLYAQRAFTWLSFMMAGYAGFSVVLALHRQVNTEVDALLDGAAAFLFVYAAIVHFEPFVNEWRLSDASHAFWLYIIFATGAAILGAWFAVLVLEPSFSWVAAGAVWALCLVLFALWRFIYPGSRNTPGTADVPSGP